MQGKWGQLASLDSFMSMGATPAIQTFHDMGAFPRWRPGSGFEGNPDPLSHSSTLRPVKGGYGRVVLSVSASLGFRFHRAATRMSGPELTCL